MQSRRVKRSVTYSHDRRRQTGQGLVEGVVGIWMVVTFTVGLLFLLLNVFYVMTYKSRVELVATEAARYIEKHNYWLGMEIPAGQKPDAGTLKQQALILSNALLQKMGLPAVRNQDLTIQTSRINHPQLGGMASITKVTLTVPGLRLPGGSVLPTAINLTETGTACETAVTPYSTLNISAWNPANPNMTRVAQVPCYFMVQGNMQWSYGNPNNPSLSNPSGLARPGRMGSGRYVNWGIGVQSLNAPGRDYMGIWENGQCSLVPW